MKQSEESQKSSCLNYRSQNRPAKKPKLVGLQNETDLLSVAKRNSQTIPTSHKRPSFLAFNAFASKPPKVFHGARVISYMTMEELVRKLVLAAILPLFVITALAVAGYFYWLHEEPRATGPLAEALLAQFDPNKEKQNLDAVGNDFFGDQTPITDRRAILEINGFDCVIRPANIVGNEILSCRRPIEGERYCVRFNFYAYQTAAGEIVESLISTYRMARQDRILGRCPYTPPRING